MTIETLRGRYRLHRFPPRQRAVTGEPLTASISAADYQRQLMDGFHRFGDLYGCSRSISPA